MQAQRQEDAAAAPGPVPQRLDRLAVRGVRDAPALIDEAGVLDHAGLDAAVARRRRGLRGVRRPATGSPAGYPRRGSRASCHWLARVPA